MKRKEIAVISALILLFATTFSLTGCSKAPGPSDQPAKTPESTELPANAPEFAIDPQFDEAGDFTDGLARISVGNKWGFINKTGAHVTGPKTDATPTEDPEDLPSEGMTRVRISADTGSEMGNPYDAGYRYGYIDETGKSVIEPHFYNAGHFSEGLAPVCTGEKWGYIDRTGAVVITPSFYWADEFSDGMAVVTTEEGGSGWSYIDRTGTLIIDPYKYEEVQKFSEGLAAVSPGHGKWGYIDKKGAPVISPSYRAAGDFSEGLAWVAVDNMCGFIDKTGAYVIQPVYEGARGFSEGLAAVRFNGKWGYIKNPLKSSLSGTK
ncbi:MAG: WG repeat-containing protein [Deltaproteobacteria bacterium]|nr:WG repeat-containing protein [Candidatus Zymogenaceae bacterium]